MAALQTKAVEDEEEVLKGAKCSAGQKRVVPLSTRIGHATGEVPGDLPQPLHWVVTWRPRQQARTHIVASRNCHVEAASKLRKPPQHEG